MKKVFLSIMVLIIMSSCSSFHTAYRTGAGKVTSTIKEDAMYGTKVLMTSDVALQGNSFAPLKEVMVRGIKVGNSIYLDFYLRDYTPNHSTIYEGDLLEIKTGKGDIYKLKASKTNTPEFGIRGKQAIWNMKAMYSVPVNIYNDFVDNDIVMLRFHMGDAIFDKNVESQYSERLKEVLVELQKELK